MSNTLTTQQITRQSLGNLLEWYDFGLFGVFSIQISQTFFNFEQEYLSITFTFLVFALGFFSRPLGSLLFGMIGDRHGKGFSVNITIWVMALGTTLIGFIPSYATIGIWSPIILVLLRLVQGLSVGGQLAGLIAMTGDDGVNHKPFLSSIVYAIAIAGGLLSTLIALVFTQLSSYFDFPMIMTWRIAFIFSIVIFVIYLIISPSDLHKEQDLTAAHQFRLRDIFAKQPKEMINLIIFNFAIQSISYILFVYSITYLQVRLSFDISDALIVVNGIIILSAILYPVFGYWVPNKPSRLTYAKWVALAIIPSVLLFAAYKVSVPIAIIGFIGVIVLQSAVISLVLSLFAELFHNTFRMTACCLTYNIGVMMAGVAPSVATVIDNYLTYGIQIMIGALALLMWYSLYNMKRLPSYKRIHHSNHSAN